MIWNSLLFSEILELGLYYFAIADQLSLQYFWKENIWK